MSEHEDICIYSSKARALEAIRRFRTLPGCSSYPDAIIIIRQRCTLQTTATKADLQTVFLPYHERYLADEDCDYVTRGTLFDHYDAAHAELQSWRHDPGFIWNDDGANVIEFTIDLDSTFWNEGFSRE